MKNRLPYAFAGWTVGLICYSLYLIFFILIWGSSALQFYWMLPLPPSNIPNPIFYKIQLYLSLIWHLSRFELGAVLMGLSFPTALSLLAWSRAEKQSRLWLSRWPAQLAFCVINLIALLVIITCLLYILPPVPF